MSSRWTQTQPDAGATYDERFEQLAAAGHDVHGEASFVMAFKPANVLDAGCGTGRVAIELYERGVDVVGVDIDRSMLERAVEKATNLEWYLADLTTLQLADEHNFIRTFDVVLAAGNVMIFLQPGTESRAVASMARHIAWGGRLIAGFQLSSGFYDLERYDRDCLNAGLILESRYSSWALNPFAHDSKYAVSVHHKPLPPAIVTGSATTETTE